MSEPTSNQTSQTTTPSKTNVPTPTSQTAPKKRSSGSNGHGGHGGRHKRRASAMWTSAQKQPAIWSDFRPKTQKPYEIFIGKRTVIGPGVTIIAEKGSIEIGPDNIISENTLIINKSKDNKKLVIGTGNVFECNSRIEAASVGDYNVFGAKCYVHEGAVIGNGCVIGARVMVVSNRKVRNNMIIFGDNMMYSQPLMTKRNRAYIHQMVITLNRKFIEQKEKQQQNRKPKPNMRTKPNSSTINNLRSKYANKTRGEKPLNNPKS